MSQNSITVSELNQMIKTLIDGEPILSKVCVRGELSNYKIYPSGHHYFTLKDAESSLRCVMFKSSASKLRFRPESGMGVTAFGRISVFPRDGAYQLYCTDLIPEGTGDLQIAYEQLKAKLAAEGLFDPAHKKPLPQFPEKIAIITSSAGAAVHDMIRILGTRWSMTKVVLLPVRVQGVEAPPEIVGAIRYANKHKVADLIITGRGGGSIEDLWAFNDECVARAIFDCQVPVISAVGHETDVTIADYVADLRAPTPSAAAELAVWDYRQLQGYLDECRLRMNRSMTGTIRINRLRLKELDVRLSYLHPRHKLQDQQQRLIELEEELRTLMRDRVKEARHRLAIQIEKLNGLSPVRKLNQGFAYVEEADGGVVKSIRQVEMGDELTVYVTDGLIRTSVKAVQKKTYKI